VNPARRLRFVLLTEDTGKDADAVLRAVFRSILRLLEPGLDSRTITLDPPEAVAAEVRLAVRPDAWRGRGSGARDRFRRLADYIATKLMLDDTFVVFHFDGNSAWERATASRNVPDFERIVSNGIRHAFATIGREGELDARMARLLRVVPFYSMEAWLYQNTATASDICREGPCDGAHVAQYETWSAERGALDEIEQIKDRDDLQCLKDRHNARLAKGFPYPAVYATSKSFTATVDHMLTSQVLMESLASLRDP
jgi:hypothetical protein